MLAAGAVRAATQSSLGVPCPLRTLTGIPCPLCGMTTSVTSVFQADLVGAVAANPAGVLAVLVAVWLVINPRRTTLSVPRWAVPAGLAVMWLWEVARFQLF